MWPFINWQRQKQTSKCISCTGRPRLWEITRTRSPECGMGRDRLCYRGWALLLHCRVLQSLQEPNRSLFILDKVWKPAFGGFGASFSFPAWPHSRHFAPSFPRDAASQLHDSRPVTPRGRESPCAQPTTPGSGGSPLARQHLHFPDLPPCSPHLTSPVGDQNRTLSSHGATRAGQSQSKVSCRPGTRPGCSWALIFRVRFMVWQLQSSLGTQLWSPLP